MTEMIRLTANKIMRAVHRDLRKSGELGRGLSVTSPPPVRRRFTPKPVSRQAPTYKEIDALYDDAEAIGLAATGSLEPSLREALIGGVTNYIDKVERVVMRRQSLQEQANPLRDREPEEIRNPGDPTPERVAQANGAMTRKTVGKGEIVPIRQHQIQPFMTRYGDEFPPEIDRAIKRFATDAQYHHRVRTANLDSNGGGTSGRLGGLGNVPQHVRDGHARHCWLEQEAANDALFVNVQKKLIECSQTRQDGKFYNLEDFGRLLWPMLNDVGELRRSTKTAVMAFGSSLLNLYSKPRCPRLRWIDDNERRLEAAE